MTRPPIIMNQWIDVSRLGGEVAVVTRRLRRAPAFTISAVLLLGSGSTGSPHSWPRSGEKNWGFGRRWGRPT